MNYAGIGVIVEDQMGNFLLHLRDNKTPNMTNEWCLVGGAIEPGENILDSAIREVKEETGLTLSKPAFIKSFFYGDKTIALIKGVVNTDNEDMTLGEGANLKFFSKMEMISFIKSLGYSNPYLKALSDYISALE